ncbi:MAG: glycosyltransferase [Oscillospiraceae bacterium]|nr:glycosyltransferase [Oscillospiraceae bacterium]
MRLQSVIIPDDGQLPSEMYFKGDTVLSSGKAISFDTFYNCFSYVKYLEYTMVKSVSFSCKFNGTARVDLCVYDGSEHIICSGDFTESAELSAELSDLPDRGFLYPRLTALTNLTFISGEYHTDSKPRDISCCIAICTYKREKYIAKNTELFKKFSFSFINRVFVIDNGGTLDVDSVSDKTVKVIANKNHGGSGGFTRGLIEALDGGFSHVVFMDDDIEFHPESLEQMTVFMSLLKDTHICDWFSAGMIPIDTPEIQYELGAYWDGRTARVNNNNLDMTDLRNILKNMDKPQINYGGWWTLCMPLAVVDNGFPYPFFIKFDDIEYGLRRPQGVEIITVNGIAVRHEAFDKKTNFTLDYYNLRNQLVVNSLYNRSAREAVRLFMKAVFKQLVLYRYDNIPIVIRAVKDFLSGVDFFLSTDSEHLNSELIRGVMQMSPLEELSSWNEGLRCDDHIKDTKITPIMAITGAGHLIPRFALKKGVIAVPLSRASAKDCFRQRAVIQYQLGGANGLYTERNFAKFVRYGFKSVGIALLLLFRYNNASADYQQRKSMITCREFWNKDLGI